MWGLSGMHWPRKRFSPDATGVNSRFIFTDTFLVFFYESYRERYVKMYIDGLFFSAPRCGVFVILNFERVFFANRAFNDVTDSTYTEGTQW